MSERSSSDPLPASAFAELLDRTQSLIYCFICRLLGNHEDARDGTQDVFVDAWRAAQRHAPPFTASGSETEMRRWLWHAAYQRAISILRRRRVIDWQSLDAEDQDDVLWADGAIPFEEQIAAGDEVAALLARLEPQDAACLILKVLNGYSAIEMAQILDITPEAARKRLSRATQRLRTVYFARQAVVAPGAREGRTDP
jgi:RNA polymerase sigma-70 factor (ECF subfamily)